MISIMKEFMVKMFTLSKGVVIWLQVLMLVNMIIPLFFLGHFEARLIVGAFIINFMTGTILYKKYGFTRILGLMHWVWIPLVVFLLIKWGDASMVGFFGLWIKSVVVFNSISIYFDTKDSIEYCRGNHSLLNG